MDLRAIEKREQREKDGIWVPLKSDIPGSKAEVLVTAMDSPRYSQTLYLRTTSLRAKYGGKETIPENEMDDVLGEVTADVLLLGWRGIELDGVELPYSPQSAREWLKKSSHFRDMISSASIKASRLLRDEFEKDVEALKKVSAPVSTPPNTPGT